MTCPSCAKAAVNPDSPFQHAGCVGCATRALAQSPVAHGASLMGRLADPYRKALGLVFGDDWQRGHALVKAERERIKQARAVL